MGVLQKQTDMRRRACEHALSAHPIFRFSFPRGSVSQHVLIPNTVIALRPASRNVTTNDRAESASLHGRSHIYVNDEIANRKQSTTRMDKHGSVAEIANATGNQMGEPQNQSG